MRKTQVRRPTRWDVGPVWVSKVFWGERLAWVLCKCGWTDALELEEKPNRPWADHTTTGPGLARNCRWGSFTFTAMGSANHGPYTGSLGRIESGPLCLCSIASFFFNSIASFLNQRFVLALDFGCSCTGALYRCLLRLHRLLVFCFCRL